MLSSIFTAIELILRLIGLWDQFLDYSDTQRKAEAEKKRQEREKAVDEVVKGETDEEIFDAQDRVTRNLP